MNNDINPFAMLVMHIAVRVFLFAWLVDIVYDVFAPETFPHFTYWTAVLVVILFNIIVGALRRRIE